MTRARPAYSVREEKQQNGRSLMRSRLSKSLASWRRIILSAMLAVGLIFGAGAGAYAKGSGLGEPPSGFRDGFVTIDGGVIHYVIGGKGPALVLIHGWPETWWEWHLVMPELAKTHTVIAVDLPGLGDSSHFTGGYDKATTARRIHQAVTKLGFKKVGVIGHDTGATTAYPYARDFPDDVTRVMAIDSPLMGFGLENILTISWHIKFNMTAAPLPENIIDNDDVSTYLGMLYNFDPQPDQEERKPFLAKYADPADRHSGYEYYRSFDADSQNNQANAASRPRMPILAMGGGFAFGGLVAASFRQVADDVREVVVPDTGHFIPEINPSFLATCANLFFGPSDGVPPGPEFAGCAP